MLFASLFFAASLRLEERMLYDEKTPEYRRTEPYQRKCATIFHDKRRTNEWNIKLKKILSYEFSVVFFFSSFLHCFFFTQHEGSIQQSKRTLSSRSRCTYDDDDDDSRVYISRSSYHSPKTEELSAKLTSHIYFVRSEMNFSSKASERAIWFGYLFLIRLTDDDALPNSLVFSYIGCLFLFVIIVLLMCGEECAADYY